MKRYDAKLEALVRRFPRPAEKIHLVTVFSDGKRALGMGRGTLLTDADYQKLSGKIILVDWGEPYDKGAEGEERPSNSGGDKESESGPVQDPEGIDDDSPELLSIVDRIRARRGETRDEDGNVEKDGP